LFQCGSNKIIGLDLAPFSQKFENHCSKLPKTAQNQAIFSVKTLGNEHIKCACHFIAFSKSHI